MSLMPDPIVILDSLQQVLNDGMPVDPGELRDGYKMFYDELNGGKRYSFAKIIDGQAQALSIFGLEDPIGGVVCYNLGYAVKESLRRRGLAIEAVLKGLEILRVELGSIGIEKFYLESVVAKTNIPSIKVAEKIFSESGVLMNERDTGTLSLYFKKLIKE